MTKYTVAQHIEQLVDLEKPMELKLLLKAVSKQRPRVANAGHIYTPPQTVRFEKYIAKAVTTLNRHPFTCPVAVEVRVVAAIPKSWSGDKRIAAEAGAISPLLGDLDNKVKAITDGMNGLAYVDDRQINNIYATRRYGKEHSIHVVVKRNGLTLHEYTEYKEYGHDAINRRRRAILGQKRRSRIPV